VRAALAQVLHAGFVYVNVTGDEDRGKDRGITDEQSKMAHHCPHGR
jgi:hypothetical protein